MTLGRHYLSGLSKQANVWTGLRAVNGFMNKGVLQRLLPRMAKYKGAGGFKGKAYNTANFLSSPTAGIGLGMGGSMALDSMSKSDNSTVRAVGNNPVLNLGVGALMPVWTAANKIPNAIGNMRMAGSEMQNKLKGDAQLGKDRAISDFITLSTQGQRMFEPDAYLNALDQRVGSPQATARARSTYQNPKAPRELSTFEKLWKPTDELVQHGIEQKAWEFGKEGGFKDQFALKVAPKVTEWGNKAMGWLGKLKQTKPAVKPPTAPVAPTAPAGPMTAWDKTKTLGGAGLGLGFAGASLYGGAKKIFGDPYDPAQVAEEANAAAQAAIQKRMNNLTPMERFAVRMDPTLAVGFMEKEMPGSVAKWERETGQRYNPGFLAALHQKATGPTKGKYYEFDDQGNQRFYPNQGV